MNKRIITFFLMILAAVIVIVVARDMASRNPGKSTGNPYKLEIDTFRKVDPSLIKYKEYRQIKLSLEKPAGIALQDQNMYLIGDQRLLVISARGKLLSEHEMPDQPYCITAIGENLLGIGFRDHFGIIRADGTILLESEIHSNSSVFTAIATRNDNVFIADAGNRRVLVYDLEGNFKREIRGETGDGSEHGFIIPSPNFHLDFDPHNNLWVTNPGMHAMQQYNDLGELTDSWSKSSPEIEGFSGCCNPAKFTFLPDGRFITSEKGLVRIKVYSASGEFESVVAAPEKFTEDGEAPDLAVDKNENIIALDNDKRMIRFFKPI